MAAHAQLFSENLGFSQDWVMNSNPNVSSSLPPPLPPPVFDSQQQQVEGFVQSMRIGMGMGFNGHQGFVSSPCSSSSTATSMSFSQAFASLLQKQGRDLDLYLHFQGDKLRQVLQQQRKQELKLLLNCFQSRAMALLRQKEEDIEKLRMKTKILEEQLKKTEQETETWQKVAREKEEMMMGLTNILEQVKANLCLVYPLQNQQRTEENDAESVCDCEPQNINRGDDGNLREKQNGSSGLDCRWCNSRSSCVVLLPCKHLCCCKPCEALLSLCPVCHSVKQGSIEIFLS